MKTRVALVLGLLLALAGDAAGFLPAAQTLALRYQRALPADSRHGDALMMGRKGRPKMPAGMGGPQAGVQQQAPTAPPDGSTVFYLYCRTGPGKPWYPVSAMKGDAQSKGLINAWLNSPVGKQVFKDQLDGGMARSIYDSERRLASMATEQYRQLKDYQSRLQWGFKILDQDVMAKEASGDLEKQKIVVVNKSMLEGQGLMERASNALGNLGNAVNDALPEDAQKKLGEVQQKLPSNPFAGLKESLPKNPFGK